VRNALASFPEHDWATKAAKFSYISTRLSNMTAGKPTHNLEKDATSDGKGYFGF